MAPMPTHDFTDDTFRIRDVVITNSITGVDRSSFDSENAKIYELPIHEFRIWDAYQTVLTTAANDDLGITTGAFGSAATPYIGSGDLKAAGATTRYGRTMFTLPPEYTDGGLVSVQLYAGMVTTVSDNTATVDVELRKSDLDGTSGSDIVSTSAQSCNSLTAAAKEFVVTPTGLVAGDTLDIRIAITVTDGATVTAVIGAIYRASMLLTIQA